MSTAGASSSAGVDQRVLRSSDVRTKRLLKRQMIATLASTLTAATSSSASKSRKTKPDSTRAEETEELAAKKSKAEAAVTITELSKDSEEHQRVASSCTADGSGLQVTKIERIENPHLENRFHEKQKALMQLRGPSEAQVLESPITAPTRRTFPRS